MNPTAAIRKPASVRRLEIIDAAAIEFAEAGLSGTGLESIAARAGISHPRVVQMFGTKRDLFLEVVDSIFDQIEVSFNDVASQAGADGPSLVALGSAYLRLLQRNRTIALVVLQSYAASADDEVRKRVTRRYTQAQRTAMAMTGADSRQIRSFIATGLVVTVSTALALPGKRDDAAWATWLLELADTSTAG